MSKIIRDTIVLPFERKCLRMSIVTFKEEVYAVMTRHFDEYEATSFPVMEGAYSVGRVPTRGEIVSELARELELELEEGDVVVDDLVGVFERVRKERKLPEGVKGKGKGKTKVAKTESEPEPEPEAKPVKAKRGKKEDTKASPQAPPAEAKTEPEPEPEAKPVKAKRGKKGKETSEGEASEAEPEVKRGKAKGGKKEETKASPPGEAKTESEAEPEAKPVKAKGGKKAKEPSEVEGSEGEATEAVKTKRVKKVSEGPRKRNEVSEFTRLVSMVMKGADTKGSEREAYEISPSFKEGSKSRETAANLELFAKFSNKQLSLKEVIEGTLSAMAEAEEKAKIVVVSAIVRGFFGKESRERMLAAAELSE
jgi:hypothetical protein